MTCSNLAKKAAETVCLSMFDTVLWGKGPGLRGNWVEDLADGFLRCMGLLSQRQSHVSANFSPRSADYSDHRPVCAVMSPAVAQNSTNTPRFESDIDANQALNDIERTFWQCVMISDGRAACWLLNNLAWCFTGRLQSLRFWRLAGWAVERNKTAECELLPLDHFF